jgi:uncharacterized protein YbjT (DUF2867 family)
MYVVAGVTGHTGRVVAETLLSRKEPVRVIVRDGVKGASWKEKGAQVAIASLTETDALTSALRGAWGAYLLIPPQMGAEDVLGAQGVIVDAIAAAVKRSGIPHVVALSSLGAAEPTGTGPIRILHRLERSLTGAASNQTFLRAAYFAENSEAVLSQVQANRVFPTFLTPGKAISMVATVDIGYAAASLLLEPASGTKIVDLLGPAEYAPEDVAVILSRLTGHEIKVLPMPLDQVVPIFTSFGVSRNAAELFREMFDAINKGMVAPSSPPAITMHGSTGVEKVLSDMLQHATA